MRFGSFTMRFGCLWLLLLLLHFDNSHSLMFGKKTLRIRVVSYNVLSSHLASPSQFSTLDPKHLEASSRLPIVLEKLKQELDQHRNVIVCLQEVSHDWAGAFHTFFANRGYHMSTGLYGKPFNGYMGVCLAWPMQAFETIDVKLARLSDKRPGGWPNIELMDPFQQWLQNIQTFFQKLQGEKTDHWEISQNRYNMVLTATLKEKDSGLSFVIGNYHMPCAFWAPQVMTIHSDLVAQYVQQTADTLPYVLAGDFNIKPVDSIYRFLTTGDLSNDDPAYPTPKWGMEWTPTCSPMKSAYKEYGSEPDFTNYARIREDEPFIDTLDYIFLSPSWKVESVRELPLRQDAGGPFPNLDLKEPSDHVVIAASLLLS